MVDGAAQWLPPESGVGAVDVGQEILWVERRVDAGVVVAPGVGSAKVDVRRFAEVAVEANMAYHADVLALVCGENIRRIAAVNLSGALQEPVLWRRQETRERNAGVIDPVFAANKIVG